MHPVVLLKRARFEKQTKSRNLHMKEFLHKSQDGKDLYYFHRQRKDEKDSENPLFMSIIDLEKACSSATSNFDVYRPNIFLAPLRDDRLIIFDGIASELVKYNFQSPIVDQIVTSDLRMTAPVLCSDNILAVLVDAEVIKSDDQEKIEVFKNGK